MSFFFEIDAPYRWVETDRRGRAVNRGRSDSLAEVPVPALGSGAVYAVVPGEEVVVRHCTVPSRNRSRVLAAVPYALEESLSDDVDDLHFSLLRWHPGTDAEVAVVSRERMREWLDALVATAHKVDGLVPDYMLVPCHPQARYTLVRDDRRRLLLRERDGTGLVLDDDMLPLWWQGVQHADPPVAVDDESLGHSLIELGATRVSQWEVGNNFVRWLEHGEPTELEHLLQGAYAPRHRDGSMRKLWPAAAILVLAVLGWIGMDGYEFWRLARENRQLDNQIQNLFQQTFPDAKLVRGKERVLMEQRLNVLKSGYAGSGDLPMLLAVTSRVLPAAQATLNEFDFRSNALTFNCTVNDFAALDQLKQQFESETGIVTELQSSNAQEQKVSARFRLRRSGA